MLILTFIFVPQSGLSTVDAKYYAERFKTYMASQVLEDGGHPEEALS